MKPQNLTAKECNFFLALWGEDARRAGEGPWFVGERMPEGQVRGRGSLIYILMLKLKIVSPEKIEFDGEVVSVLVPGTLGSFEILQNHAPIISSLEKGVVTYETAEGKKSLEIIGGFVSVNQNQVNLCVEL